MATCLLLVLLICLTVTIPVESVFPINKVETTTCSGANQYFDFGILDCGTCGDNMVKDSTGYSCSCSPGFRANILNPRVLSCEDCSGITTSDGYYCAICGNNSTELNNQCTCDVGKQPIVSTPSTSTSTVTVSCESCPANFLSSGSCMACPDCCGNPVGQLCFNNTETTSLNTISATSQTIPNSLFIEENLQSAVGACRAFPTLRNQTACEQLANMCVMEHYARTSDACVQYERISGAIADGTEWNAQGVPWLYYETLQSDTSPIVEDGTITTSFTFSGGSTLEFFVAQYRANGTFLGISSVTNGLIQLCKDKPSVMNAAYEYGTTFRSSCTLDASTLDGNQANIYFDMFLRFIDQGTPMLYPVPVQVSNFNNQEYVRRFFLIDNVYGVTGSSANGVASTVRYAKSMSISINIQPTSTGRIFPPILRMEYADVTTDATTVTASFSVSYTSSTESQNEGLKITLSLFGVLAFLYAAIETSGWRRRQGLQYVELTTLLQFILYFMGNLANVFFVVVLGWTSVLLIFFKRQNVTTSYVAGAYQEYLFTIFLSVGFGCKCIQVLAMILQQSSVDLFLMDWERPRAKSADDGSNKVSIWRTYFIANEWNEIQTCRKISTTFQLFAVLLFLEVIGFKNLALLNSSSDLNPPSDTYQPPYSPLLRYAIGGLVYLIIGIIQVLYFKIIHERFITDSIRDFVDLCSVANVSVFVLSQHSFGYYIHGRSVHGKADTDMAEMSQMLKREEENLVSTRGLVTGTENQVFELMIPAKMRQQYDKIYQPLQLVKSQPAARGGSTPAESVTGESMKAYNTMKTFLTSFIDHSLRDLDYIVKEKLFLEKLFGIEFQEPIDKAFFTVDEGISFTNILFYGREIALLVFDMLLFLLVDFGTTDFVLAAIITYLVGGILKQLRQILGRYNLARKTLIDKRFLI